MHEDYKEKPIKDEIKDKDDAITFRFYRNMVKNLDLVYCFYKVDSLFMSISVVCNDNNSLIFLLA